MASKHLVRGIGEVKEPIYEFEWKIPNFVSLPEELYFSSSLSFPFVGTSWNFYIFPNGTPESPGFVSMGLRKKPTVPPVILNVSFAFKTLDGKKVLERKNAHHLFRDGFDYYTSIRYISRRDLLKKASEFLPSNVLTIICYVKFLEVTEDASKLFIFHKYKYLKFEESTQISKIYVSYSLKIK